MANYSTGLERCFDANQTANSAGTPDVVIAQLRPFYIQQLGFFEGQKSNLEKHLKSHSIKSIPAMSVAVSVKSVIAARIEMEKIWLISHEPIAKASAAFYPLDLSSARSAIRLSGVKVRDLLARLCAVDFDDSKRNFFATSIHHVGVHIHAHDGVFDIYMPRSFGQSVTDYIIDISRQYHVHMA